MPYPPIEPYETGKLQVSDLHELYYEQSGNPEGKPVIFLHGGPGGGTSGTDRLYFDPSFYRIVLMDQRDLRLLLNSKTIEDIEKLRKHLKIQKWLVFGGSWGSTLSLAYSETHPECCVGLVLRGIFTLRKSELEFFYQNGSSHLFPEAFDEYIAVVPENERSDVMKAYHKMLNSEDDQTRLTAARAWSKWEMSTSRLIVSPKDVARAAEDDWANAFARIENHYFVNEGWMRDGQLLEKENIDKIRHLPTVIVQGRYDVVCPFRTAWDLYKQLPEAKFVPVADAGHSSQETGINKALVEACDEFRKLSWD